MDLKELLKLTTKTKLGCLEWMKGLDKDGYGWAYLYQGKGLRHKTVRAHRLSYSLSNNIKLKPSQLVLHWCDNRKCINPNHLFLGTQKENVHDCIRKKRRNPPRGKAHWNSRLKESDILVIRDLIKQGVPHKEIGLKYRVSERTIKDILQGKTWKHT